MKATRFKTQNRKVGDYLFSFYEADESAYIHAMQNQIPCGFILFVDGYDERHVCVAHYERIWDKRPNPTHFENFVQKFLKEGDYRESYRVRGIKITEVLSEMPKSDIDPRTMKTIQRINFAPPHTLSFRDFMGLKTYGRDSVSRLKESDLLHIVNEAELAEIKEQVPPEKVVQVLRWIKRGLKYEHAIHKVHCDMEVEKNASA